MKLLTSFILTLALIAACSTSDKKELTRNDDVVHLKDYQQYAFDRIIGADADDQGFDLVDSFYLWSYDDFGQEFKTNRITRTYNDGFFRYTFWTRLHDTALIYAEDSIPAVQLLQDTIFDANGDGAKDLVAMYNPNNGKCPPDFTMLFIMDTAVKKFRKIVIVERILYAKFHPNDKTITSEITCGEYKEQYKFKWTKNFGVDTIYTRVTKL